MSKYGPRIASEDRANIEKVHRDARILRFLLQRPTLVGWEEFGCSENNWVVSNGAPIRQFHWTVTVVSYSHGFEITPTNSRARFGHIPNKMHGLRLCIRVAITSVVNQMGQERSRGSEQDAKHSMYRCWAQQNVPNNHKTISSVLCREHPARGEPRGQ